MTYYGTGTPLISQSFETQQLSYFTTSLKFCSKTRIIEGVPSLSTLSLFITFFLNAAVESQIFAGVIDGIKLMSIKSTSTGVIDIWHGWHDVTFVTAN